MIRYRERWGITYAGSGDALDVHRNIPTRSAQHTYNTHTQHTGGNMPTDIIVAIWRTPEGKPAGQWRTATPENLRTLDLVARLHGGKTFQAEVNKPDATARDLDQTVERLANRWLVKA